MLGLGSSFTRLRISHNLRNWFSMSTYEVTGGCVQISTQRGYRQFNFSPDMRRFFFTMVVAPSCGYMNSIVILRSVCTPFGNLWKNTLESEKKMTCGKQCQLPLNHEFIRRTRRAIQSDDPPGP